MGELAPNRNIESDEEIVRPARKNKRPAKMTFANDDSEIKPDSHEPPLELEDNLLPKPKKQRKPKAKIH